MGLPLVGLVAVVALRLVMSWEIAALRAVAASGVKLNETDPSIKFSVSFDGAIGKNFDYLLLHGTWER